MIHKWKVEANAHTRPNPLVTHTYLYLWGVGSPWLWLPHCAFNHVLPRSALHAVSASMGIVIIPSPLSIVLHSRICKNSNTSHQDGVSCVGGKYCTVQRKWSSMCYIEALGGKEMSSIWADQSIHVLWETGWRERKRRNTGGGGGVPRCALCLCSCAHGEKKKFL